MEINSLLPQDHVANKIEDEEVVVLVFEKKELQMNPVVTRKLSKSQTKILKKAAEVERPLVC
jgi:hypothetical protein